MEKISDNELDNISGGLLFYSNGIIGANKDKPWEVIDNNGNVVGQYETKADAIERAKENGNDPLNTLEINWNQLSYLRKK